MVPCSSPVSTAPTPTNNVPAVVAASRETAQDTQFKGSLFESFDNVARLTSNAPGIGEPKSESVCNCQPSGKKAETTQTEAQPADDQVALLQRSHGHGKAHSIPAKSHHVKQANIRSVKNPGVEGTPSDSKAKVKEVLDPDGSACSSGSGCVACLPNNLIPSASPAKKAESQPAIREDIKVRMKTGGSTGKLTTPARADAEATALPGKWLDSSPATPQTVKAFGEHEPGLFAEHGVQGIVVNALPAAQHGGKQSTPQPTTLSTPPVASNSGEQPGDSRTLDATANSLKVGISSGTHGWLRVRAELDQSGTDQTGTVADVVVASSAKAAESLTRHLPPALPAKGADSQPATGKQLMVLTKEDGSTGKLKTPARSDAEVTALPGKRLDTSPAPPPIKAFGEHEPGLFAEHGVQGIVVNALPAAQHEGKQSTPQPTTLSTPPMASNSVEQPGDSRTLTATANSLEVGISSGTHGWLRVRAELDQSGTVAAAVVASSATAAESLTRHLPAMSEYLAQETTRIGSIVVHASSASGYAASSSSDSAAWSGLSNSAAGERDQRRSDRNQQLDPDSEVGTGADLRTDVIREGMQPIRTAWPGLLPGQRGTGTHWVSVRV